MKVQGRGQAKVLTFEERELLFTQGFSCSRDLAFYTACYYLACRIHECCQLRLNDVYQDGVVRDVIILRKHTTKGKQATREIATHPRLAAALKQYTRDARELLQIKQIVGDWEYLNLLYAHNSRQGNRIVCPACGNDQIVKAGFSGASAQKTPIRICKNCKRRFSEKTMLGDHPEISKTLMRLGVHSSRSFGFLYLDPKNPFLFPGLHGKGYIGTQPMMRVLKEACAKLNLVGVSSHSWRRTALTEMYRKGVPLTTIQKISGHSSLAALQRYLEVDREQMEEAVISLPKLFVDNRVEFQP